MNRSTFIYRSVVCIGAILSLIYGGRISAQTCDTTDWVLVMVGPTQYQTPWIHAVNYSHGPYLLGQGDTTAQVEAILRLEGRVACNRPVRRRDFRRLSRLHVLPWGDVFCFAKKFRLAAFYGTGQVLAVYPLEVRIKAPDRLFRYQAEMALERIPVQVFPELRQE